MKECAKCGNPLKEDQIFCNKCGTKWEDPELIRQAKEAEEAARLATIRATQEKAKKEEEAERRIEESAERDKEKRERIEEHLDKSSSAYPSNKPHNSIMYRIGKTIKFLYVALAFLVACIIASATPTFPASSEDIFILRISNFTFPFIAFVIPGLIISFEKLRNKIPLFKRRKFGFTIVGWVWCLVIALILTSIIHTQFSDEYNIAERTYKGEQIILNESQPEPVSGNTENSTTKETATNLPSAEESAAEKTESSSSGQEAASAKYLIKEGELGTTGKSEVVDGKEYIYHYVPAGTYTVSAKSESAKFFVVKSEMEKNSSGFMESVTVSSHRISKGEGPIAVEVKSDERLIMVINSVVEFTKTSP